MKGVSGILLLLFLVSCETNLTDDDWPEHDPKLVIVASLRIKSDSVYVYCRVSRTMGLGERYNASTARVDDAEVNIINDGQTYDVQHRQGYDPLTGDVNYMAAIPRGKFNEYTLTIREGDLKACTSLSHASVPLKFDTLVMNRWRSEKRSDVIIKYILTTPVNRLHYDILIEEQFIEGVWMEVIGGYPWTFFDVPLINPTTGSFFYFSSIDNGGERYTLTARSPKYTEYKNSLLYSDYSGSPFEPQAKNPPFNVTGDGIGFFWYELVGEPVEIPY